MTFAGALIQAFARYAEHPDARPDEDPVGYRQATLWLDRQERAELVERLGATIARYEQRGPGPGRQEVRLSTVVIPELPPPAREAD